MKQIESINAFRHGRNEKGSLTREELEVGTADEKGLAHTDAADPMLSLLEAFAFPDS